MAVQVGHLTSTVKTMASQLDTNSDFVVDAVQQVRDELNGRNDALYKQHPASNAGGDGAPGSATDAPLVNKTGRPTQHDGKDTPYSIQCAFCLGDVPKSIAKHCVDCDLHFHPGHLQSHRDEWPCPFVDHDLCPWCAERINEEDNVMTCQVCQ